MNASRWTERPLLLAGLALAFALVPAWVAVVTYRGAQQKDARRFEASVELQAERLRENSGRQFYGLTELRKRARGLPDDGLHSGAFAIPGLNWQEKFPHLVAFGYAERKGLELTLRWRSEARAPVAEVGEKLSGDPQIEALLRQPAPPNPSSSIGCVTPRHQLIALLGVPGLASPADIRGYVVGWIDLDSLCRDESAPLVRDHVVVAAPLGPAEELLPDAVSVAVRDDDGAAWTATIRRGLEFDQESAPAPWIAVLAAGLSAVPMLVLSVLAGRAAKLRGELSSEREQLRQQRFFTQSVSHEFRTPLSVILSGAELLENYADKISDERRREVLAEIKTSTRRMNEMIERVLVLGRIESSHAQARMEPVHLPTFCAEIVRRTRSATDDRCVMATQVADEDVNTDPALLRSILENLLSNAVKYSEPHATVDLRVTRARDQLTFGVQDRGIGIPKEELKRAGEMFFRAANVGSSSGTGLGLAVARRCAELLGGTLTIESVEGEGTTATVMLPCTPP